jgi:hypothetical protein
LVNLAKGEIKYEVQDGITTMKDLCGCFKSHSFTEAVIQSVFEHFDFLVVDIFHWSLLWHILVQQTIGVLVTTSLPVRKGPGKVARALERFINQPMSAELFAVVVG